MNHYKIKPLKSERFWFNYRTGAVNYTSEYRPSSNWRWVQVSAYHFDTKEEKDKLLLEADIVFKLYETEEYNFSYDVKIGSEKNLLIRYVVKKNKDTNNLDSLYF